MISASEARMLNYQSVRDDVWTSVEQRIKEAAANGETSIELSVDQYPLTKLQIHYLENKHWYDVSYSGASLTHTIDWHE